MICSSRAFTCVGISSRLSYIETPCRWCQLMNWSRAQHMKDPLGASLCPQGQQLCSLSLERFECLWCQTRWFAHFKRGWVPSSAGNLVTCQLKVVCSHFSWVHCNFHGTKLSINRKIRIFFFRPVLLESWASVTKKKFGCTHEMFMSNI
jgi:hypothetical protein